MLDRLLKVSVKAAPVMFELTHERSATSVEKLHVLPLKPLVMPFKMFLKKKNNYFLFTRIPKYILQFTSLTYFYLQIRVKC